jgi:hypothetical protein
MKKRKGIRRKNPVKRKRLANPDVDAIVSRGQRYQTALENYVQAVRTGHGLPAARREVKAARKEFENSLGVGVPLTVIAAAFGAGAGALGFGPIGAVIGALAAGAAPSFIESFPEKGKTAREDEVDRLEDARTRPYRIANPKGYRRLMR